MENGVWTRFPCLEKLVIFLRQFIYWFEGTSKMYNDLRKRFPYLAQLLGGYLGQDFDIFGPTLEDAVQAFVDDVSVDLISLTRQNIDGVLMMSAEEIEVSLQTLCSDYSIEPGMSVRDYLLWLDGLLAQGLARKMA